MRIAKIIPLALSVLFAAWSGESLADPPKHAPAHGWRNKHHKNEHEHYYEGHSGRHWDNDFEISSGRCNRQAIATVVGGVVGGAIASKVASPENRTVATLVGVIAGAVVGNRVGHELDEADRGCFGHALEIGVPGQRITWTNETTRVRYQLSPGADRDRRGTACREYTLVTIVGRDKFSERGLACQTRPGYWQVER